MLNLLKKREKYSDAEKKKETNKQSMEKRKQRS